MKQQEQIAVVNNVEEMETNLAINSIVIDNNITKSCNVVDSVIKGSLNDQQSIIDILSSSSTNHDRQQSSNNNALNEYFEGSSTSLSSIIQNHNNNNNIPIIESLIAQYGTHINEEGFQVLNFQFNSENLPEQLLQLQNKSGSSTNNNLTITNNDHNNHNYHSSTDISSSNMNIQTSNNHNDYDTTKHHQQIKTNERQQHEQDHEYHDQQQELLYGQRQVITELYHTISNKINTNNTEFIKIRLKELIGTLDCLELIGSYTKTSNTN